MSLETPMKIRMLQRKLYQKAKEEPNYRFYLHPDLNRCFQAHRQSPLLSFFKSASEVRVLSSTGVTRLPRSYDPLRLPDRPSSYRGCWRCDLHQRRVSPNYPDHLSYMPCSIPRRTEQVRVGFFPIRAAFPG